MNNKRHLNLRPFNINEKIDISLLACKFFLPLNYDDSCEIIGKAKDKITRPLNGSDFLKYLDIIGRLKNSNRYMYHIVELLKDLSNAHILTDMGISKPFIMGIHYYFLHSHHTPAEVGLAVGELLGALEVTQSKERRRLAAHKAWRSRNGLVFVLVAVPDGPVRRDVLARREENQERTREGDQRCKRRRG